MPLFGFDPTKCKTQCRLGVGRVKLLRNKKQVLTKTLRKEVAELLRSGKHGSARIRVEAVIREHNMLEAFELLELYLELLAVRAELLAKTKEIPPDMVEAISSLIYAGERVSTDLAEVNHVAKMLVSKYNGVYKEAGFPHEVVSDLTCRKWQVNDKLVAYLAVTAPLPEKKLQFLEDIAAEHDVEFDLEAAAQEMLPAPPPISYVPPVQPGMDGVGAGQGLAQGWQPGPAPAVETAPPAQPAPGWRPPVQQPAPGAAAQQHVARVLSGGSVFHRADAGAPPGVTQTPGRGDDVAPATGWQPPKPEDIDRPGRAFQQHVGHAAAWRQVKLHGASPRTSPDPSLTPSQGSGDVSATAATAASAAHPPPAAAAGLDLPGTAQSSGGSTPSGGDKPATPAGSYTDAGAAAEAARRYSQMAQQAAQRAEEFAATEARKHQGGGGGGSGGGPAGGSGGGPAGGSGGGSGAGFLRRTPSEIQRAYDAAPGPPSKADALAPGPPSAPPVAPAASADAAADGGDFDPSSLPSVPTARPPTGGAPAVPPPVESDLDELTRRFEMLKKR